MLQFALFAYNLLRFIGQTRLTLTKVPLHRAAQRRRIRTVIQSIITLAAKVTWHARRPWLRLGRGSPWLPVLQDLYRSIALSPLPRGRAAPVGTIFWF